jgi:glycosyltransferase involved in cell wall biosynthesis
MWKLGQLVPVQWIRRTNAVARALRSMHGERPFDMISFPDGYGEGFAYSFAPVAPFAVQLFGPASLVQRWDRRRVPPIRARMESWLERRPAARADVLISATRAFAATIAGEWSIPKDRIRIIRNPLNTQLFRPSNTIASPATNRILFVGHLQRLKGLEALANAIPLVAKRHSDVEFQLIGNDTRSAPGGGSMREWLMSKLAAVGTLEQVRFSEPVPQSELVSLYQDCTVFVLPSLNDVYPNAVLEAMGCARPCVVTSSVGVAELIREGACGSVVPPNDAIALADALSQLLSAPQQRRDEMGMRGRRIVERACARDVIAAQTIEVYRDVLGANASPQPKTAYHPPGAPS